MDTAPTTPPKNSSLLPKSTPIHTLSNTTSTYSQNHETRDEYHTRLSNEMAPYFIGPMPAEEFLDQFMPRPSGPLDSFDKKMFGDMSKSTREEHMRGALVRFKSYLLFMILI